MEVHDRFGSLYDSIADLLRGYSRSGLAASLGALDLYPANANQLLRTTLVSRAILSLSSFDGGQISNGRLRKLLNSPPVATDWLLHMEDPLNDLIVEEIVLPIGTFKFSSGASPEGVSNLERLVDAIATSANLDPDTVSRAIRTVVASVAVADEMFARAGLQRGTLPAGRHHGPVTVPNSAAMDQFRAAVSFTQRDLDDLLRPLGVSALALGSIAVDSPSGMHFSDSSPGSIPRPFLREANRWVLASPSNLAAAVSHAVVSEFARSEELTQLCGDLAKVAQQSAFWSLHLLGLGPPRQIVLDNVPNNVRLTLHQFDSDKLLHLIVVTDDFDGFTEADMDAPWRPPTLDDDLGRMIAQTEEIVFSGNEWNSLFHLIVLQPSYRSGGGGAGSSPTDSPILALTTQALHTISLLEAGNSTLLWYWAVQRQRLFDRGTRTFAWNALDEFWSYRKQQYSYYMTDEGKPTFITFDLFGVVESKQLIKQEKDPRGIQRPDGEWTWAAKAADDARHAYVPMEFTNNPAICICGDKVNFWLLPQIADTAPRGVAAEVIRMLGYWLDEVWDSVETHIAAPLPPLGLEIAFADSDDWGSFPAEAELDADPTSLAIERPVSALHIDGGLLGLLVRNDNASERLLVRKALSAVLELGASADPAGVAAELVDRFLPLGRSRAMIAVSTAVDPALETAGLPAFRSVKQEVRAIIGDDLGDQLATDGLLPGVISPELRSPTINRAVAILFEWLERRVASVRRDELLNALVMQHERTIAERERGRIGLPSRLLDARSTEAAARRLRSAEPELVTMSLALRFLVEYVTARPPTGSRPMSLTLLDELAGIGAELIQWGMESDLVAFGLVDATLTMLPSGRLAIAVDPWADATDSLLGLNIEEQLYQPSGGRRLRPLPDQTELFDTAAEAEFGLTFSRLAEIVGELIAIGNALPEPVKRLNAAEFRSRLRSAEVTDAELEMMLGQFSIAERSSFLAPEPPDTRVAVYPWRFNRGLSYLRRPLLVVSLNGSQHVVWGNRHLMDFFDNLVGVCLRGRLKAKSSEMARAMGIRAHLAGMAFSNSVADCLEAHADFQVHRHVKKIGGRYLARSNGESIGDIDILGVDLRRRRLWSIEAKNLAIARTPHEVRHEIDEILGSVHGIGSAGRHIERTEWLRSNLPHVLRSLALQPIVPGEWQVRPLMVTESELLSAGLAGARIPAIAMRRFADLVASDPGQLSHIQ